MQNRTDTGALGIQLAVANASPGAWRDAVVAGIDSEVVLACLGGEVIRITTNATVIAGEPVAFHPVAELLAVGAQRYPARRAF